MADTKFPSGDPAADKAKADADSKAASDATALAEDQSATAADEEAIAGGEGVLLTDEEKVAADKARVVTDLPLASNQPGPASVTGSVATPMPSPFPPVAHGSDPAEVPASPAPPPTP